MLIKRQVCIGIGVQAQGQSNERTYGRFVDELNENETSKIASGTVIGASCRDESF